MASMMTHWDGAKRECGEGRRGKNVRGRRACCAGRGVRGEECGIKESRADLFDVVGGKEIELVCCHGWDEDEVWT